MSFAVGFAVLATFTLGQCAKFPDSWTKCPKAGDNEECLRRAIRDAVFSLKDGNKGLGVIPLDPLHFKQMNIQQGGSSPVNINLTFYDVDLMGSSRLTVTRARIDWDAYTMDLEFSVAGPIQVLGDYTIGGKVLVLPIQGQGRANVSLEDFSARVKLEGKEQMKGSKKYFDVTTSEFMIQTSRVRIHLTNLFDGIPNLGDNMNRFLNDNWKEIIDELKEPISNVMGQAVQQVANSFFQRIPVESLYQP